MVLKVLIALLLSASLFGQHLTPKQTKRIADFGIQVSELNLDHELVMSRLNYILKKEKKRKRKKIWRLFYPRWELYQ